LTAEIGDANGDWSDQSAAQLGEQLLRRVPISNTWQNRCATRLFTRENSVKNCDRRSGPPRALPQNA
jgi:hypothetical protein